MTKQEYKVFKQGLINDNFDENSYYIKSAYLWFRLTEKQVNDLKATCRRLKVGKEVVGGLQVGAFTLRDI